ncbi:carbamoyltransferase C-terminal domain-containing protein [Sorangium sp. So ce385]
MSPGEIDMIVVGISNNDLAGACLVRDNNIVAAVSEERFTRRKDDKVWPARSIAYVLGAAGLRLEQVDYIAYGWNAGFNADKHLPLYFDRIVEEATQNPAGLVHVRRRITDEIHNDKAKRLEFDTFLAERGLRDKAIYLDHHECHALGAFVCSPFERALVLTCDGRGDYQSLTVSRYGPNGSTVLQRETSIDSLGYFYGRITRLLGYTPNRHEGKITGLAAHGDPEKLLPLMQQMIAFTDGRIRARCGELYQPSYDGYSDRLRALLAQEKPEDIAAAAQRHTENLLVDTVRHHLNRDGDENLCLAGGVFGNVKINQRLREIRGIDNVYVLPCMGDGGLALAAAVGAAYLKRGSRFSTPSMALGPDSGDTRATLALLSGDYPELSYHRPDNIISSLVEALAHDQVLGMVKGRMEFGPRALCNRSIIYHAADKSVNDWLNARMHRTEFMPFAPVSAVEHAAQSYIGWKPDQVAADFMTMTYECHPEFSRACPAAVHIDGTARPQIVYPQSDPFMHRLLTAWHARTAQMALINTSFNKHEEPIISSARDAFDALRAGMVDFVVINEQILVWKRGRNRFARQYFE